jgi:hypothetical protein
VGLSPYEDADDVVAFAGSGVCAATFSSSDTR